MKKKKKYRSREFLLELSPEKDSSLACLGGRPLKTRP